MFFELNTRDVFGNTPWKRSVENVPEESFEGSMNAFAQLTLLIDPDAKLSEQKLVSDATADSMATASLMSIGESKFSLGFPNILPDG
jgi:hypothetical protein